MRNLILLILALIALVLPAQGETHRPKVVLVIVDYLTLSDLTDSKLPGIRKLTAEGAVGLICPGINGTRTVESSYASVSAGAYCWASSDIDQAYFRFETLENESGSAEAVFKRRTGWDDAPPVVHLELPLIGAKNKEKMVNSIPGMLGDVLADKGKKAAVFGNSDLTDKKRRRAVVIAATGNGSVALGDISSTILRRDPVSPTGFVTDADRLASEVNSALKTADFVVADFGDTARVELNKSRLSARAYSIHRGKAFKNLDRFLSKILDAEAGRETIILASLSAAVPGKGESARLAPIVIRGPDGSEGSLISATTRTSGLISGFDIAPTVLAALDIPKPKKMAGAPITAVQSPKIEVRWLDDIVLLYRDTVWQVLGILAAIGIASITAAGAVVVLGKGASGALGAVVRVLLVASMACLLAMFLAAPGEPAVVPYVLRLSVWMVGLTAAAFGVSSFIRRRFGEKTKRLPGALPIVTLALITTVVLFIEACRGGQLIRFALPSMTDFRGHRFYGIGNEYMGVWLGSALVAIVWLRECFPGWKSTRRGRFLMFSVSAAIVLGLAVPVFGANAGGTIAAVVGLGAAYISGVKGRFSVRDVMLLVVSGCFIVAVIGILDAVLSRSASSHIGLAASTGSRGGYSLLLATVVRKLSMNLSLIATPQSQTAIIGAIPFFILWFTSINRKIDVLTEGRPAFRSGIVAAIVGAGAAFLFNDSGIVAGALIFGVLVLAVLYTLMDESGKDLGVRI